MPSTSRCQRLKLLVVVDEKAFRVEPTGGWDFELDVDDDTTVSEIFEKIKVKIHGQ